MSGKEMNDNEWVTYMMLHYVKNNENRNDIIKDLDINESYFYGRNRKLGIKREMSKTKLTDKKDGSFKFDLISGSFVKGKIGLK